MLSDAPDIWSPLVTLQPTVDAQQDTVLISDPWTGVDAAIDRTALLDRLTISIRRGETIAAGELGDAAASVAHWWERGWHPCLDYTLWSAIPSSDVAADRLPLPLADDREIAGRLQALPQAEPLPPALSLGAMLLARRTQRRFVERPLTAERFTGVLQFGLYSEKPNRTTDATSSVVAFDVYLIVYAVDGILPGAYRVSRVDGGLHAMRTGELRSAMVHILFGQTAPRTAAFTLVLVGAFDRWQRLHPGEAALRHLYVLAGEVAQRLCLVATAYGLGTFPTPALRDRLLAELLGLDAVHEAPIYSLTCGLLAATASGG